MADQKMASNTSSPAASGALRGASLLILLQIASRAITFIANQLLLRFLTAQLLGISTQLEVYYLSVLFFARESLRVAIQRQGGTTKDKTSQARGTQAVVNLSYLSILLGVFVAGLLGWLYVTSISNETTASAPHLIISLYIYAVASIVELLSEPAFMVMQTRLQFGARAAAESIATFSRCAVTLGSAVIASRGAFAAGVLPFALGQLSYGVTLLVVYAYYGLSLASVEGFSLLPKKLERPSTKDKKSNAEGCVLSLFPRPTLNLARSMIAQSLVKHILTQGDTLLVSALASPTSQGVYALANNYGGLAARLVFQPVEESSRSYFSRLLASSSPDKESDKNGLRKAKKAAAEKASADLTILIKLYTTFSAVVVAIGPTAAPLLISLVAGPRWASSGAGAVLAVYALYIPLLALNGVSEAFVASVATEAEVHAQSLWMGAFSLAFAAAGFVFLRVLDWGARGLVVANAINMVCRIVWCAVFIKRYFGRLGVKFELSELRPSGVTVGAAVVASQAVARLSGPDVAGLAVRGVLFALVKIASIGAVFIAVVAVGERQFLMQCIDKARGQRQRSTAKQ
ncbi:hypothetical protein PpBr36_02151 [Pyricularia pennisetigena]|uniref:hypothetical protein n=1 Tax=Pyricularia pennisetigena TaxID=1578925 RepID=UPI0011505300|nr:hypothetical protein PpBr36_02151 [Pyricularia pennisetigena]TLS29323.1 hypothetical protein PpBr36_02151 [Pyricularia pennisetigena]